MTRSFLPPDYVKADSDILYRCPEIKDSAKIFLLQLRGLAWGRDATDWVSMDDLITITRGKSKSSIWGYMSTLRTSRRLSWRTAGDGKFMFAFENGATPEIQKTGIPLTATALESINKINTEEEDCAPKNWTAGVTLAHPLIREYMTVTGHPPTRNQYEQIVSDMSYLHEAWGVEFSVERLRPYYTAWVGSKRRDNQPYSRYSAGWLDWAKQGREVTPVADVSQNDKARAAERLRAARMAIASH